MNNGVIEASTAPTITNLSVTPQRRLEAWHESVPPLALELNDTELVDAVFPLHGLANPFGQEVAQLLTVPLDQAVPERMPRAISRPVVEVDNDRVNLPGAQIFVTPGLSAPALAQVDGKLHGRASFMAPPEVRPRSHMIQPKYEMNFSSPQAWTSILLAILWSQGCQ
jgi:hypothetical protein